MTGKATENQNCVAIIVRSYYGIQSALVSVKGSCLQFLIWQLDCNTVCDTGSADPAVPQLTLLSAVPSSGISWTLDSFLCLALEDEF